MEALSECTVEEERWWKEEKRFNPGPTLMVVSWTVSNNRAPRLISPRCGPLAEPWGVIPGNFFEKLLGGPEFRGCGIVQVYLKSFYFGL